MKNIFRILSITLVLLSMGCIDDDFINRLDNLEDRVTKLEEMCSEMNTNISSLQTIVTALQTNDYVTAVTPIVEDEATVGYIISFVNSESVTIYFDERADDVNFVIGVREDSDGKYYWTTPDGNWLLDTSGSKILVQNINEKPLLKIVDEYWYISYNDGKNWQRLCKYTNEDSVFKSVTQDSEFVYFVLVDGTVIVLPKGTVLDISFDEADLVVMYPCSKRSIGYTVSSITDSVMVEVTSSADIKAKVVPNDNSAKTGTIEIVTGDTIDEYSKVIVFVSNGNKVIMRSITFEEPGLIVEDNATKIAPAQGGQLTLEYLSNIECEVLIPENAKEWITIVPYTRALTRQFFLLNLTRNTRFYRSATVEIRSLDGNLSVKYQVEQDGDLGVQIDPSVIPDNEIWYTSINNEVIPFDYINIDFLGSQIDNTNATLLSNTYSDGIGVLRFDETLTRVDHIFEYACGELETIYLPNSIKSLNYTNYVDLFGPSRNLKYCYIPNGIEKMGSVLADCDAIEEFRIPDALKVLSSAPFHGGVNLHTIQGNHSGISKDRKTFVMDGTLFAFAPKGLVSYSIDEGILNIASAVFRSCESLESVQLPVSLKTIGSDAFGFSGIKSISLTPNIEVVGYLAFRACAFLSSIYIPEVAHEIEIDSHAFHGTNNVVEISGKYATEDKLMLIKDGEIICVAKKSLKEALSLEIPGTVIGIGDGMFSHLKKLESVVINEGVEYIGSQVFYGCENLKTISIPSTMTHYGNGFVADCPNLEAIYGPQCSSDNRYLLGVNLVSNGSVPSDAQYGWQENTLLAFAPKGIKEYVFEGNIMGIGGYVFDENHEIESIIVKASIEAVLTGAFEECGNLKVVDLPSSVKLIEQGAFSRCEKLNTLKIRATDPPTWLFFNSGEFPSNAKILVPNDEGVISEYKRMYPQLASQIYGGTDF